MFLLTQLRVCGSLACFAVLLCLELSCAQQAPLAEHTLRLPNVSVTILRDSGSTWVEISNQSTKAIGVPSGLPFLNVWSCEVRGADGRICSYSELGEKERRGPPCGGVRGVFINPGQKERFPFPLEKWFELTPKGHHVASVAIPLIRDSDGIDYEIDSPPFSID